MQEIYAASNAVEAHMLADLLKQQGIDTHVQGEYLQGAIGELPASGLVRLIGEEADYEKARAILKDWEASIQHEPAPPRARLNYKLWMMLVGGLLVGTVLTFMYHRLPGPTSGIDHNRDGVLDEKWTHTLSGRVLKLESDRNLDKRFDLVIHYDERGAVKTSEQDDNFDGVFETRATYAFGNPVRSESDTNNDGVPDLIMYYKNGVVERVEYINAVNGFPQRVEYYKLGVITHNDVDSDLDGKLDRRDHLTFFGAVSRSESLVVPAR